MNRKELEEFINSGILENYILGETTPEENSQVEALKEKYPEVVDELNKLELSLEKIVSLQSIKVPETLSQSIFDETVGSKSQVLQGEDRKDKANTPKSIFTASPIFIVLLILSGLAAIYFYQSVERTEQENEILKSEIFAMQENCDNISRSLEFLLLPETKKIILAGTEAHPFSEAYVWYHEGKNEVLFSGQGLPELSADLSYQLWAIIDGTPSDMGVVEWSPDQKVINVSFTGKPQAFAITIEPKGGSVTPTLEQLIVMGSLET